MQLFISFGCILLAGLNEQSANQRFEILAFDHIIVLLKMFETNETF